MAEWVSHLIVADRVLEILPWLKKHEFCVGNIAPDCNIPNEDWSEFTPSREITHWMKSERKKADDCSVFRDEYILKRIDEIRSEEELSLGEKNILLPETSLPLSLLLRANIYSMIIVSIFTLRSKKPAFLGVIFQ